jgi:S-DNA-T family DNA segregation ATPase FtsK/SpoIIIE
MAPNPDNTPAPNWKLPSIDDMLAAGGDQEVDNSFIREQVEIIEHTLESFGAPANVVEINQGPTVTQFGVEPQFIVQRSGKRTKVKVGKIASLADDLALALAAHSVRVQAPVPGKGYVGLEIPNPRKSLVSLRDVMKAQEFSRIRSPLRIGLGQNVAGVPAATDLTKMPHLLIAGATGAGKSVCVNGIIACLLLQNTPEDLRLVMVDPKRVELTAYNGIPHLVAPVVVDMERVIGTLQWALREMDNRYKRLADAGARNISDYNRKLLARGEKKLPYIVIFIDELADLMMLSPEDTERGITRLAQMARATGIHMVISTQRPSVDVVTGLIKANFPARIAFAVASSTDSRVILDTVGAERLLGQGDMLFQSPDASAPVRLQGCFVSDRELNSIIEYWRGARRFNLITAQDAEPAPPPAEAQAGAPPPPVATPPIQQPLWEDMIVEAQQDSDYEDDLMPEAIALVRQLNRASTSLLQRRFRIGYTRAARLMDMMEQEGVIGPPTGTSKPRDVFPPGPEDAERTPENANSSSDAT